MILSLSSSSESDVSDKLSESDSSSSDDSSCNRKGKRKSNKRDGEKKKCAHSVPSLVDSCDDSHEMAMDDSTPSILVDTFDDDGNDVSPAFQEYAQILVNQSTASQNLKLRVHDEKQDALRKEMDNQKRTIQELGEKFDKHTQELPGKFKQSEDNVVARLFAVWGGNKHAPGKGKDKGGPSLTTSRCHPVALGTYDE